MKKEKQFYTKNLLDQEAIIRTWHFTWKFPFIKIVDFTANMKNTQKLINRQMNAILDSKAKESLKLYDRTKEK